jgi:hypothetical protein
MLGLATVLTLAALGYADSAMSTGRRQLKVAKEDAFTSIHALWRARAVAYGANGDESRYLLDHAGAAKHERDFFAKTASLAQLPRAMGSGDVIRKEQDGEQPPGFTGYLADEFKNITFRGEREAAVQTLRQFEEYLGVDRRIRQLEASGRHKEAIELCIGTGEGQSDWVFEGFDKALGLTLEVNQLAFDGAVHQGLAAFDRFDIILSTMAAAIAVCIFVGLAVRIREYQ